MFRLLLDTNILLDALVKDRPCHSDVWELLEWCNKSGDIAMACTLSFKDVYYILQREVPEHTARVAVRKLMEFLVIAPADAEVAYNAIVSDEPDFEDGLVRCCAELNNADFIITRDRGAFANSTIRSVSACEFMKIARERDRALLDAICG